MTAFEMMTAARAEAGWNDDSALCVALQFIEERIANGKVTAIEFQLHLEGQIDSERNATDY